MATAEALAIEVRVTNLDELRQELDRLLPRLPFMSDRTIERRVNRVLRKMRGEFRVLPNGMWTVMPGRLPVPTVTITDLCEAD